MSIANRIYQEIIPRELTFSTQLTISHDRDKDKSWEEKIFSREGTYQGKEIKIWGM